MACTNDVVRVSGDDRYNGQMADDDPTVQVSHSLLPSRDTSAVQATLACLIGPQAGRVYTLSPGMNVIGRALDAEVCLNAMGVSRRHSCITVSESGCELKDLGSTNGTIYHGSLLQGPTTLKDGDRIGLGAETVLQFRVEDQIERHMRDRLYELATRDPLTNAHNRRFFDERLDSEWPWARRHSRACALLWLDIDHFKSVNDGHGHIAGDAVLEQLSLRISKSLRREDLFARVGGEEFAVLCRATDAVDAVHLAERLRRSIDTAPFVWREANLRVTVSIGVATSNEKGIDSVSDLMERADKRLYAAKKAGRNRVMGPKLPTDFGTTQSGEPSK